MQKLINLLALTSFGVSAAIVGAGAYVYLNKDALIESAKEAAIKQVTASVTEALPGLIKGSMPEIPNVTGGIINESSQPSLPNVTGGAIPF